MGKMRPKCKIHRGAILQVDEIALVERRGVNPVHLELAPPTRDVEELVAGVRQCRSPRLRGCGGHDLAVGGAVNRGLGSAVLGQGLPGKGLPRTIGHCAGCF